LKSSTILIVIAIVLTVLGARYFYGNQVVDLKRERNNALAEADSLRIIGDKLVARLAFTTNDRDEMVKRLSEEMAEAIEGRDLRLRAMARLNADLHVQIEDLVVERTFSDNSTTFESVYKDSVVSLTFGQEIQGEIRGDILRSWATVAATLGITLAITCDEEEGMPEFFVETMDPRLQITGLDATVDEGVACLEQQRPRLLGLQISGPKMLGIGSLIGAVVVLWILSR